MTMYGKLEQKGNRTSEEGQGCDVGSGRRCRAAMVRRRVRVVGSANVLGLDNRRLPSRVPDGYLVSGCRSSG